jgi:hypothetical protein
MSLLDLSLITTMMSVCQTERDEKITSFIDYDGMRHMDCCTTILLEATAH